MNQFKLIRILFFFVFLVACAPSQSGIETAIYKKQTATATSTPTETLIPAGTPTLSSLPSLIPSPTPDIHIIEKIESNENVEIWPEVLRGTDYASIVQKSVKSYQDNLYDASAFFQDYTFDGDYLNWGLDNTFIEGNNIMYDGYGVPRIWVDDTFYYNPVTIAQFALNQYGNYIRGDETARSIFLNDINALLSLQDNNGAFRYNYGWNYYLSGETYCVVR